MKTADRVAMALRLILTLAVALVGVHWLTAGAAHITTEQPHGGPGYTEQLITEHGCWTGEQGGGRVPGHAVATLPGDVVAELYPADIGFEIWLDDAPGTVHAFCP